VDMTNIEFLNRLKPKEVTKDEDLEFLEKFRQVDPRKLGELLGQGYEYRVYEYGDDKVMKIPKNNIIYRNSADDVFYNYLIAKEMFPEYVLPTDLIQYDDKYVVIQEKLNNYRHFTKADLEDPNLREQFEDILGRNNMLIKRELGALDLWGVQGVKDTLFRSVTLEPENVVLDNVAVIEDEKGEKRLVLPDFDLLNNHRKSESLKDVLVSNLALILQKKLTRDFLGYRIAD
jgi:hypothetical protein